jgi:hypothetical protein
MGMQSANCANVHQAPVKTDAITSGARLFAGIGSRLMRSMGWQEGGGLGRQRQGRPEPLQAAAREKRRGLGA